MPRRVQRAIGEDPNIDSYFVNRIANTAPWLSGSDLEQVVELIASFPTYDPEIIRALVLEDPPLTIQEARDFMQFLSDYDITIYRIGVVKNLIVINRYGNIGVRGLLESLWETGVRVGISFNQIIDQIGDTAYENIFSLLSPLITLPDVASRGSIVQLNNVLYGLIPLDLGDFMYY